MARIELLVALLSLAGYVYAAPYGAAVLRSPAPVPITQESAPASYGGYNKVETPVQQASSGYGGQAIEAPAPAPIQQAAPAANYGGGYGSQAVEAPAPIAE